MKTHRACLLGALATALAGPLATGQSTAETHTSSVGFHQETSPAVSVDASNCISSGTPLATTHLENNADATNAASALATQLMGAYTADPTKEPDLSGQYGVMNVAVLAALLCGESAKAVATTLTAEGTTAQTNKQNGAPSSSNGSTSAAQKIGVPQLLGVAVENGAITNNVTGNTMTLSTSAYGFVAGFTRDTQSAYATCPFCVQLGASATFNLTNTTDPLQNATRKQVSQWQVKYTFKDTSIRSRKVVPIYRDADDQGLAAAARRLAVDLSNRANASGAMVVLNRDLANVLTNLWKTLQQLIKPQESSGSGSAPSNSGTAAGGGSVGEPAGSSASKVAAEILKSIDSDAAYQRDLSAAAAVSGVRELTAQYAADLKAYVAANKVFEAKVKNLQQGFNGDLTFGEQFPTVAANASAASAGSASTTATSMPAYLVAGLDLAWEPHTTVPKNDSTSPLKLNPKPSITANFAGSFYTNPDAALNETTFRGGTAALQWQWNLGQGPFIKNPTDKSQVTVSLSGKYQRLQENEHVVGKKADIVLGNVKLEIPISSGVSFPLSITFANSAEQIKETYVRGNFGISFDLDKLASLMNAK